MARFLMACLMSGLLVACNTTQHRPYDAVSEAPPEFDRAVQVDLSDDYYAELPDCVTVLPAFDTAAGGFAVSETLEAALIRYARDRFSKVIGGAERRRLEGRMLVDLTVPEDRAYYARRMRCLHFLEFRPWRDDSVYAVVWSRKAVGIDARITDADGDGHIWRARHVTARSDGSLPLSPLGVIVGAFEATNLEADADLPASMADDVARRLIATLPDLGLAPLD